MRTGHGDYIDGGFIIIRVEQIATSEIQSYPFEISICKNNTKFERPQHPTAAVIITLQI